jgi:hypothetical protein
MVTTLKEGFETAKFLDSEFGSIQYVETNEAGKCLSAEDVCKVLGLMPYWKLATIYSAHLDKSFTTTRDYYPEYVGVPQKEYDYLYTEELTAALNEEHQEFKYNLELQIFIDKQSVYNLIKISHKDDSFKDKFVEYIEKQF